MSRPGLPNPPAGPRRRAKLDSPACSAESPKIADLSGFNPYARRAGVTGPPRIGSTPQDPLQASGARRRRGDFSDVEANRRRNTSDSDDGCSDYGQRGGILGSARGRGERGGGGGGGRERGAKLSFASSDGDWSRRKSSTPFEDGRSGSGWGGWRAALGGRSCTALVLAVTLALLLGISAAVFGVVLRSKR